MIFKKFEKWCLIFCVEVPIAELRSNLFEPGVLNMRIQRSLLGFVACGVLGAAGCSSESETLSTLNNATVAPSAGGAAGVPGEAFSFANAAQDPKLWFAPPWWNNDHEQAVLVSSQFLHWI